MKRRFLGWFLSAATVAVLGCSTGHAAQMLLSDLVNGGSIQSGDKIFSDFTYTKNGDMPAVENVTVETIDQNGQYGIRFFGGFIDLPGGDSSDALVTFNVSVSPDSDQVISGVTLSANPAVFNGPGLASVTETFVPDIDNKKLVIYDFGDGDFDLVDSVTLDAGYRTLPVQKDLILRATGNAGAVTMSFFDQVFVQVPEPSSLALAAASLLGVGFLRRRHG